MLAFENFVINYSGAFPATQAVNASAAGATNGTPYIAAILNQEWGPLQDLLLLAGLVPSGTTEVARGASYTLSGVGQQVRQAMENLYGAPGELVLDVIPPNGTYFSQTMAYGASAGGAPAWYSSRRVLPCQGQAVLISSYPELAAAIYCGDGNNASAPYCYKATTNSSPGSNRSTAGTYIVLPDFRQVTIRGWSTASLSKDPDYASRLLASQQADAFQGHWHNFIYAYQDVNYTNVDYLNAGSPATTSYRTTTGGTSGTMKVGAPAQDGSNGSPRTGTETRMYNASCNIGIRY